MIGQPRPHLNRLQQLFQPWIWFICLLKKHRKDGHRLRQRMELKFTVVLDVVEAVLRAGAPVAAPVPAHGAQLVGHPAKGRPAYGSILGSYRVPKKWLVEAVEAEIEVGGAGHQAGVDVHRRLAPTSALRPMKPQDCWSW
ncbi:hypothetical protein TYRP_015305 [Tyrophagus putrescentiae]|nr:hypothetical protein TYRP_015305 [Tyrophagus putrescentiae]